jgi:hypothetical protein
MKPVSFRNRLASWPPDNAPFSQPECVPADVLNQQLREAGSLARALLRDRDRVLGALFDRSAYDAV